MLALTAATTEAWGAPGGGAAVALQPRGGGACAPRGPRRAGGVGRALPLAPQDEPAGAVEEQGQHHDDRDEREREDDQHLPARGLEPAGRLRRRVQHVSGSPAWSRRPTGRTARGRTAPAPPARRWRSPSP